ncbi:hypothetical protein DSO57_1037180 [Entomophthora muscae]|uniref:Uncharacterized protein n=1 Tax=Entomophthora muscae TaxID=34485 RepID=A0ACC2SZ36_9FUNG|nr:hypothetical protein DSO57_1037180 [Entomophthora muscae]
MMHLYQRASNAKVNVDKTAIIKGGSPRYQPRKDFTQARLEKSSAIWASYLQTVNEMEPKLLSDLVTRMRKWKYKMLNRDAKIQALDDSFTQSYGMPPTLFLSRRLLRKN